MKKLFTLLLVVSMAFASFAQRTAVEGIELDFTKFRAEVGDTLLPGNWANATGASIYNWSGGNGYILGTNAYGDQGYGQVFEVTEPYAIGSAIFWIAYREGEVGDVEFTVWDFSTGEVGDVLGSKLVSMDEIAPTTSLSEAYTVTFDEVINVTGDYLIGADLSGLSAFEAEVYEFAQVSSKDGDGAEGGLVYTQNADGDWECLFDMYEIDFDAGIFPIIGEGSSVEESSNNFTVNAYPNPFTNEITISNPKVERVVVYNLIGQEVLNTRVIGNTVNTSNLSSGVYVVSFEGNGERAIRKMIKQ